MIQFEQWEGFEGRIWKEEVNVRDFIQKNYTPYQGGDDFLAPISPKTAKVWEKAEALILEEIKKGIIDVETNAVSGIDNFAPGYIDKDNEVVVGLQTDAPLKRIVNLYGGTISENTGAGIDAAYGRVTMAQQSSAIPVEIKNNKGGAITPVSYTHLTLPTT